MSDISDLHQTAAQLREEGQTRQSLAQYEEALIDYLERGQTDLLINVLLEKAIAYKHLFQQHNRALWYALLAEQAVRTATAFAEKLMPTPEQQALLALQLGEVLSLQSRFPEAVEAYQTAVDTLPEDHFYQGNQKAHLALALAATGQAEQGLALLETALQALQQLSQTDAYTQAVWLSGAYLKQALILTSLDRREEAQQALQKAQKIIEDHHLSLRHEQLLSVQQVIEAPTFSWETVV